MACSRHAVRPAGRFGSWVVCVCSGPGDMRARLVGPSVRLLDPDERDGRVLRLRGLMRIQGLSIGALSVS
jgi:hypothetical protein